MPYKYPTDADLTSEVIRILKTGNTGKDWRTPPRPKNLNAYQISGRFNPEIARPVIDRDGFGGKGGSKGNETTLTQKVMYICKRLAKDGLVAITYQDCEGTQIITPLMPDPVVPSYGTCGSYEWIGPLP